jgi:hypothetical protein
VLAETQVIDREVRIKRGIRLAFAYAKLCGIHAVAVIAEAEVRHAHHQVQCMTKRVAWAQTQCFPGMRDRAGWIAGTDLTQCKREQDGYAVWIERMRFSQIDQPFVDAVRTLGVDQQDTLRLIAFAVIALDVDCPVGGLNSLIPCRIEFIGPSHDDLMNSRRRYDIESAQVRRINVEGGTSMDKRLAGGLAVAGGEEVAIA